MIPPQEEPISDVVDFEGQFLSDAASGKIQSLESYLERYPEHREEIETAYGRLTAELQGKAPPNFDLAKMPTAIGPYEIVERLGIGGQGIVYRARDTRLQRDVALKVLRPVMIGSNSARERFRREAEIISRLDDPGLCGVFEANLSETIPYISMRFLPGESLGRVISRRKEEARREPNRSLPCFPESREELDQLLSGFEAVARSLHVAHEAGVIHRDIKPGNLILTDEGKLVLCDFGLARSEDSQSATLTLSKDTFGTPAYMSPEQVTTGSVVDRRTDVYSLGITLFESLTLVRPFHETGLEAQRSAILHARLPNPATLNSQTPRELTTVLRAAVEKERDRRYSTAAEFADELARVRLRQPISAQPPSVIYQVRKFVERNRRASAVLLLMIVMLVAALWSLFVANDARGALQRKSGAESRQLAVESALSGDILEAKRRLRDSKAIEQAWESRFTERLMQSASWSLSGGPRNIDELQLSRDADLVVVSSGGELVVADREQGSWQSLPVSVPLNFLERWSLSPDGQWVALTLNSGTLELIGVRTDVSKSLEQPGWRPAHCAFHPRANRLAVSAHDDTSIRVLNLETLAVAWTYESPGNASRLQFSEDGKHLHGITASGSWRVETHRLPIEVVSLQPDEWTSLSDDGALAVRDRSGRYRFHGSDGKERFSGSIDAWDFVIHPSGSLLADAAGRAVHIYDPWSGSLLGALAGHEAPVTALAFARSGRLVSADAMGNLCAWDLDRSLPRYRIPLPRVDAGAVNDTHIVTLNRGSRIVWESRSGLEVRHGIGPPEHTVHAVHLEERGSHLVLAGTQTRSALVNREDIHCVSVYDVITGAIRWSRTLAAPPRCIAVRSAPLCVAVGLENGVIQFFDSEGQADPRTLSTSSSLQRILWNSKSDRMLILTSDTRQGSSLAAYNVGDLQPLWKNEYLANEFVTLAEDRDGERFAIGGRGGEVSFGSSATGTQLGAIEDLGLPIDALAYAPDEPRIAVSAGGDVYLLAVDATEEDVQCVAKLRPDAGTGLALRFAVTGEAITLVGTRGIEIFEATAPNSTLAAKRERARRERAEFALAFSEIPTAIELSKQLSREVMSRAAFHESVDTLNRKAWTVTTREGQPREAYERAHAWSRRAVQVAAQRPRYWNTLGMTLLRLEKYDMAIRAFERAEKLHTQHRSESVQSFGGESPFNLYPMAIAYYEAGDPDCARETFEAAEAILPHFRARRELDTLRNAAAERLDVR